MTVTPLNDDGVTPELVSHTLAQDSKRFKSVFCVAITEEGPAYYCSGSLSELSFAVMSLQKLRFKLAGKL